jgi:hypothetical protein
LIVFTDEELLASARKDAFEGLLKITALRDDENALLKAILRKHFTAILRAIDDPVTPNPDGLMTDLDKLSDEELTRCIMTVLKAKCDQTGMPYPPKLVAWLSRNDQLKADD